MLLIATTLYHIVSVANQCRFVLNYLSLRHLYDFGRCLFSVNGAGPYGRFTAKPYFSSSDNRGLHKAELSPFQKKFYAKLYRLRIVEQKRFVVSGVKYTEDLKRFHRLQDEYLLLVNNDSKSVVELVDFISEQEEKIQQIEGRQKEI